MEELYDAFVRKLLRVQDDSTLYATCSRDEFFRIIRQQGRRNGREIWRRQYYYRCLAVVLANAFIRALEQHRNYVTAVDVFEHFPQFNFYTVFSSICTFLGGMYRRGKCYTALTADDFKHFIQLRGQTQTPNELIAKWKQYLSSRAAGQQPVEPAESLS